jgi:hypothetical protein
LTVVDVFAIHSPIISLERTISRSDLALVPSTIVIFNVAELALDSAQAHFFALRSLSFVSTSPSFPGELLRLRGLMRRCFERQTWYAIDSHLVHFLERHRDRRSHVSSHSGTSEEETA